AAGTGQIEVGVVGCVHKLHAHAGGQPVLVDGGLRAFTEPESPGELRAASAEAGDDQPARGFVVPADAGEVRRQVLLQAAHDHLENAADVLTLAGGAGDL